VERLLPAPAKSLNLIAPALASSRTLVADICKRFATSFVVSNVFISLMWSVLSPNPHSPRSCCCLRETTPTYAKPLPASISRNLAQLGWPHSSVANLLIVESRANHFCATDWYLQPQTIDSTSDGWGCFCLFVSKGELDHGNPRIESEDVV